MNGLAILSVRVLALSVLTFGLSEGWNSITTNLRVTIFSFVISLGLAGLLFLCAKPIGALITPRASEDPSHKEMETSTEFAFTLIGLYLIVTALFSFIGSAPDLLAELNSRDAERNEIVNRHLAWYMSVTSLRLFLGVIITLRARGLGNLLTKLRGRSPNHG